MKKDTEKLDPETRKILTESKAIKGLLESESWPILRDRLVNRIKDLLDISNVEGDTPDKMALDMLSRKKASAILFDFLKTDIEGGTAVANDYQSTLNKQHYIIRE